jgi:hypothetical protein
MRFWLPDEGIGVGQAKMIGSEHETAPLKFPLFFASSLFPLLSSTIPFRYILAKAPSHNLKHQSSTGKLSMENSSSAQHPLRGVRKIPRAFVKILASLGNGNYSFSST